MVKSRSQRRTLKQLYRYRVKTSSCRGKSSTKCQRANGCKRTRAGHRRSYCRHISNRRTYKFQHV